MRTAGNEHKDLRPGVHYNAALSAESINPHADSCIEILHTILLGNDKYIWFDTTKGWSKDQETVFTTRLQSANIDGLSISPLQASYMVQYKNALNGKYFKTLQQLAIFQLDDTVCPERLFDIWKATGNLGALLWFPEIDNMEQYLVRGLSCSLNFLLKRRSTERFTDRNQ